MENQVAAAAPALRRVCVFLGSSNGLGPRYLDAARDTGTRLAHRGTAVVYGGASVGCMNALADAALAAGGQVVGVLPRVLIDKEIAHRNLTEFYAVESMHARKLKMAELSDAFIALPGGLGTLEEIFEMLTWCQLGIHSKPCCFVNVDGFYDPLVQFLDQAYERGFLRSSTRNLCLVAPTPAAAIELVETVAAQGIANANYWQPPQAVPSEVFGQPAQEPPGPSLSLADA